MDAIDEWDIVFGCEVDGVFGGFVLVEWAVGAAMCVVRVGGHWAADDYVVIFVDFRVVVIFGDVVDFDVGFIAMRGVEYGDVRGIDGGVVGDARFDPGFDESHAGMHGVVRESCFALWRGRCNFEATQSEVEVALVR